MEVPLTRFQSFVEFFQRVTKLRLTAAQEKVAGLILREAGEFIAVGTGKSTLFDMLEAYAGHENADYVTRIELVRENEDLKVTNELQTKEIEKLRAELVKFGTGADKPKE